MKLQAAGMPAVLILLTRTDLINHIKSSQWRRKQREEGSHIRTVAVPLEVLSVNEGLNALLQVGLLHGELQLREKLRHQQLVAQRLARFHYAHNRRIDLHASAHTIRPACPETGPSQLTAMHSCDATFTGVLWKITGCISWLNVCIP